MRLRRQLYAPLSGSPVIGAGDPSLAAATFIGAVGPGAPAGIDLFGM